MRGKLAVVCLAALGFGVAGWAATWWARWSVAPQPLRVPTSLRYIGLTPPSGYGHLDDRNPGLWQPGPAVAGESWVLEHRLIATPSPRASAHTSAHTSTHTSTNEAMSRVTTLFAHYDQQLRRVLDDATVLGTFNSPLMSYVELGSVKLGEGARLRMMVMHPKRIEAHGPHVMVRLELTRDAPAPAPSTPEPSWLGRLVGGDLALPRINPVRLPGEAEK